MSTLRIGKRYLKNLSFARSKNRALPTLVAKKAARRQLTVYLGDPVEFTEQNSVALTYAPVPSFAKFKNVDELHPYPWLRTPHAQSIRSFSAWRGK